jgi:profilin
MSWQTYVDSNLVGSKAVSKAAIFGHDGSKWAASAGFNVTADEAKKLVAGFKDANSVRSNGVFLNGVKYLTLRADDRSIYGKKVHNSFRRGFKLQTFLW